MRIGDNDQINTWGSIPFGTSQIQVRHIVFWISLVAWFALTLVIAQVPTITAFAFNLTFLITLLVASLSVRSISLTKMTACFCAGGLVMAVALLITQALVPVVKTSPFLGPFLIVPMEDIGRILPLAYLLWSGRRFSTWTLGATDILLMGCALGAGFGFVSDAYAHKLNTAYNHFFVLVPNAEILNGHISCGAAIWTGLAAGTLGLAFLFYNRSLLFSILAPLGFVVALLDHISLNYCLMPSPSPWIVTPLSFITGHGYVAFILFCLVLIVCIGTDSFVQISSLPRAEEFKILRRKDRKDRLDELWDCILDMRRLAYAHYRYKRMSSRFYPVLRPVDLSLTVAILSKRLINRYTNVESTQSNTGNTTLIAGTREGQLSANFVQSAAFNNRIDLPERYEILSEVGSGGMGVIYKGRHRTTGADIAIKVMHPKEMANKSHFQRFEQEARTATTLHHPNIVLVHDFGITEHSVAFLVMEWLDGPNLEAALRKSGKMNLQRFLNIFEQCASALGHSHKKGIIHRDVKPSNIIITAPEDRFDVVKLVDFGIAKVLTSEDEETLSLTQTGEILGSPKYMSPEQCMGKKLDYRSDIYSLGCVMYEAIVGIPPLSADNSGQMFYKHMFEMPPRPTSINPELEMPDMIERILFKALQKEPEKRYSSMEELEAELHSVRVASAPPV